MENSAVEKLAMDFRRWGVRRVKRVQSMTKKHGVVCSDTVFSTKKKG